MGRTSNLKADLEPAVLRPHRLQGFAQILLEHVAVEVEPDALGVVLDAGEEALDDLDVGRVVAVALGGLRFLQREPDPLLLLLLRLLRAGKVGLEHSAMLLRHLGHQGAPCGKQGRVETDVCFF